MECPHIPELAYGEWSEQLHQKVVRDRIPIAGSIELTFRCNLRCAHCYAAYGRHGIVGQRELTAPEIDAILGQAADEGCLWLLLTGGEPLVRPDFPDIYTGAKRRGYLLTLFTNGTLITPQIADLLAEWRPFAVEITLYGSSQQTYERVTGVAGSHARCMRGIELLLERGLPLKLKTILLTINQHELAGMREYAASLGLGFRFDPVVNPGLDGSTAPLAYRLPVADIVRTEQADAKRSSGWRESFAMRFGERPATDMLYLCGAGREGFHIDPYGRLAVCILSREPNYDLRSGSFAEGWKEFVPRVRDQKCDPSDACRRCDLRALCGQCPGWRRLEPEAANERLGFMCHLAHARAEAFLDADTWASYCRSDDLPARGTRSSDAAPTIGGEQ